jgi:G8 domain.
MLLFPAGFNLTLDVADTYFRVWVIEGHLHFQRGVNITMQAEMIVINGDDAHFSIGSETHPFVDPADIIMHGHWRSLGLPLYGVKCISLTSGRLTFYGQRVPPWMVLAPPAAAYAYVISVWSRVGQSPVLAGW